jgi:hypothetical protein
VRPDPRPESFALIVTATAAVGLIAFSRIQPTRVMVK